MAPLTRSVHYELPELPLEAPVKGKSITASSYPIALGHPQIPRLLKFKGSSGKCYLCDQSGAILSCSECGSMVLYCNAECQVQDWPQHKDVCAQLKENLLRQKRMEREDENLEQVSQIINKVFTSDYTFPGYKCDPKLIVPIKDNVSFGSLHDVLSQSDMTMREFQGGLYKCTSITPYENCAPLTIYHHESVDPCKIVKQCILMSKDFNDHSHEVNQVTQPDWCTWEDSDSEYTFSESESDVSDSEIIAQQQILGNFVTKVYSDDLFESDAEDYDYDPEESESDSSFSEDISDNEVEYLVAESKKITRDIGEKRDLLVSDMDVSEESESESDVESNDLMESVGLYKEFKINIIKSEHNYESSDCGDSDYLPFDDTESEYDVSDFDISDEEVQDMLEEGKQFRDIDGDMYEDFVEKVYSFDIEQSDEEDEDNDYTPDDASFSSSSEDEEISDSEVNHLLEDSEECTKNIFGKRISRQTHLSCSDSSDDSEVSTEDERYEDFQIHLEEQLELSDSDSVEYQKDESESETSSDSSEYEMEISDEESTSIIDEVRDSLADVSGRKRKLPSVEHSESEDEDQTSESEISSDEELYTKFVTKLVVTGEKVDQDDSDDDFKPAEDPRDSQDSDSSEEEMEISDTEVLMVKDDLELSSEEELYEDFKSTVVKSRKPKSKGNEKNPTIIDNRDLIYFINSSNSTDLKNLLDNGKFEKAGVIPESFTISSEPSGMAVAVHGADWRSAHLFEDASSSKCFALVVATDMGPLCNFKKDWENCFPNLNWTSVSETQLVFNINDFLLHKTAI